MSEMITTPLTVNGRRQTVKLQKFAIRIPRSILLPVDEVIQ